MPPQASLAPNFLVFVGRTPVISTRAWGHRRGRQGKAIGKDAGRVGGEMDTGHWSKPLVKASGHETPDTGALAQEVRVRTL